MSVFRVLGELGLQGLEVFWWDFPAMENNGVGLNDLLDGLDLGCSQKVLNVLDISAAASLDLHCGQVLGGSAGHNEVGGVEYGFCTSVEGWRVLHEETHCVVEPVSG